MASANPIFATSPLADIASEIPSEYFVEGAFVSKISLRGDSSDANFARVLKDLFSLTLPIDANTVANSGDKVLFWMGPDEWLLHSGSEPEILCSQLRQAYSGMHTAVVDVSDYYTVIRLQTEHAREILARSCPFDLHGLQFTSGRCAQTKIGNAPVLLHAVDEAIIDVQVRWSYAEYLWRLLAEGARFLDGEK